MGFAEWFGAESTAKKIETPTENVEEPESKREKVEFTPLQLIQETPEAKVESITETQFWLEKATADAQRATNLFDQANKYFRAQKESTGSAKWSAESPHKKIWQEACGQVARCDLLAKHSDAYKEAQIKFEEISTRPLPLSTDFKRDIAPRSEAEQVALAEANNAYDQAYKTWMEDLEKIKGEIWLEKKTIADLEAEYNATEMRIATLEVAIDEHLTGPEKNLVTMATDAYARLEKAEANLKKVKGSIVKRVLRFLKPSTETNKETAISEAEKEVQVAQNVLEEIEARMEKLEQ